MWKPSQPPWWQIHRGTDGGGSCCGFRRWKTGLKVAATANDDSCGDLWCFRVSKGGARALDRKSQIDLPQDASASSSISARCAFSHSLCRIWQCYGYHVTAMYEKACSSSTCPIDKTLRIFWWFRFAPPFEDPIARSYKYYLWREVLSGAGSDLPVPFLDASTESQELMAVCSMHRMSPSRKSKTIKQISLKTSRIHPGLLHSASEISWKKHTETQTVVSLRRVFSVRHRFKFQAV